MIWRERGSSGGGDGRGSSDLRRPAVNIISPSQPPLDQSKFCPRCNLQLSYMQDLDIWYCKKCGWNIPKELLNPPPPVQQQKKEEEGPVLRGGRNESSSNTQGEDIAIVSKSSRAEELANRVRRLPGEDRDTDMLQAKGYTLIDSVEHQATTGDVDTISSEELKRQKERRRRSQW